MKGTQKVLRVGEVGCVREPEHVAHRVPVPGHCMRGFLIGLFWLAAINEREGVFA